MKPVFLLTLLILLIGKCDKTENMEIQFGWGGGFAGKEYIYTLNSKGEILEGEKIIKKLSKKELKEIYKLYKELPETGFKHPYNTYEFLIVKKEDKTIRYTWGEPNFKPDEKITKLHTLLVNHIKN